MAGNLTMSFNLIGVSALGVTAAASFAREPLIFFPQPVTSATHLPARVSALELAADGTTPSRLDRQTHGQAFRRP